MSPIKGLTDRRRLPRVGKIRLGLRATTARGAEYPKAVDYFVVKEDDSTPAQAAEAFHEVYGDEPRDLDVVFPSDDPGQWADANLKMYGASWGLLCRGDGETARAKWELEADGPRPEGMTSGTWANKDTKGWLYREVPCLGSECPRQQGEQPQCKAVMNLQFLLPHVRGIGAWQIDTSSFNSIQNLLSSVELIKSVTGGRIRGLPLKLRLVPKEVTPQGGTVKKKTVHVLDLSLPELTLQELLGEAAKLPQEALMLSPAIDEEEPPEDLYPTALAPEEPEVEAEPEPPPATPEPVEEPAAAEATSPPDESPPGQPAAEDEPAAQEQPSARQMGRRKVVAHAKGLKIVGGRELCNWLGLAGAKDRERDPKDILDQLWFAIGEGFLLTADQTADIACEALDAVQRELSASPESSLPQAVAAVGPLRLLKQHRHDVVAEGEGDEAGGSA